ncbi:MAG TPA: MFS transporter [bacterium]
MPDPGAGPVTPEAAARSLASTEREAVPWAVMTGLTESFMIPYTLALGGSAFQAGLLSSFRNLVLSLSQLKSAEAVRWVRSRKALVLWTARIQAVLWLPLAGVAWLLGPWAVPALIVLYTLGTTSAAIGGPAWGSLVSDSLPPESRGRFFGRRARVIGGWTAAASLAAGGILQWCAHRPLMGFALLCAAAAVSRAWSISYLQRMAEGPWEEPAEARFTFWEFIRQLPTSNFAKFTVCIGLLSFATNLASPYFAVYLLEELHVGYFTYTLVVMAGSVTGFLASLRWGRLADRFGNWVVLRWTTLLVSVLPLLWPLSPDPAWLFVANVLGGFLWGGLNLCMVNFVYDAATASKRTRCLAYFNVINGCGVSVGALTGGWLLGALPALGGSAFVSLFCVSGVLRAAAALVFPRVVHEVRPVHRAALQQVIYDLVGQRAVHVLGFIGLPAEPADASSAARGAPRRG